jgi:hypothetical protein
LHHGIQAKRDPSIYIPVPRPQTDRTQKGPTVTSVRHVRHVRHVRPSRPSRPSVTSVTSVRHVRPSRPSVTSVTSVSVRARTATPPAAGVAADMSGSVRIDCPAADRSSVTLPPTLCSKSLVHFPTLVCAVEIMEGTSKAHQGTSTTSTSM